ncbi:MAG: hypothetical protein WAV51_02055 [Microgenomates group bacterium]
MKVILHGDNTESSRNEFIHLKTANTHMDIRELVGKELDETLLTQAVESNSLFGDTTSIFIENLFSPLGKKIKLATVYANILKTSDKQTTIVIWESKVLGKEILGLLAPEISERLFAYPKIIFSFLDSLQPMGSKKSLMLLEELLSTESSELIWSMLISRVRILIQMKDSVIPERMSSWQASRLTNQTRLFTMDKLLDMHKTLLTSEYQLKQGNSPYTTADNLNVFVAAL